MSGLDEIMERPPEHITELMGIMYEALFKEEKDGDQGFCRRSCKEG